MNASDEARREGTESETHVDGRVRRARMLRAERRAQLLDAAQRAFAREGYHATSLQALLAEAGVARGTFYQYFPSMRACYAEVLAGFLERLRAVIHPVDISRAEPPEAQLIANIVRVLGLLGDDAALTRMILHEARGTDPEFDTLLGRFDRGVLDLILRSFRTGRRLGLVREGDLPLRAMFVLGAIKEAVSRTILGPDTPRPRDAVARELLGLVLRGTLVPSSSPKNASISLDEG